MGLQNEDDTICSARNGVVRVLLSPYNGEEDVVAVAWWRVAEIYVKVNLTARAIQHSADSDWA